MAEAKTRPTNQDPRDYLKSFEASVQSDGLMLLDLFERVTKEKGIMWGAAIVGFGTYLQKYAGRKKELEWPRVAFAIRKSGLVLYLTSCEVDLMPSLAKLGKYKLSGSCLHIKRLNEVDINALEEIVDLTFKSSL